MRRAAIPLVFALFSIIVSGFALAGKSAVKASGSGHRAHHGGHHHHHGGHRHHGHHHGSVFFGFGYYYYPAYYPYYAYPAQPVTNIEQHSAPVEHWWYYCEAARGYYPHVRECPSLWQRVPAVPSR